MAPEVAIAVSKASTNLSRLQRFDDTMRALRTVRTGPDASRAGREMLSARSVPRGDGAAVGTAGCAPATGRERVRETNRMALLAEADDLVADRLERRGQLRGVAGEVVLALRLVRVEARRSGIVGDAHEDGRAGLGTAAGRLVQQVAQTERVDADRLCAAAVGAGGVCDDLGPVARGVVGVLHVVRIVGPGPANQPALSGQRRVVEVEGRRDARGDMGRVK